MGRAVTSKISVWLQFQSYTWSNVKDLGGSWSSPLGFEIYVQAHTHRVNTKSGMLAWSACAARFFTFTCPASTSMSTMRCLPSFFSLEFRGLHLTTTRTAWRKSVRDNLFVVRFVPR